MEIYIELMYWAYGQLKNCKKSATTYEDDVAADHEDGVFCGQIEAYSEVIKHCAERIAEHISKS